MNPIQHLEKLGLQLPTVSTPGGNYVSVNIREQIAYVAIQFPIENESYKYQGRLGNEIATSDGIKAMELCALNVLAQINAKIGFENLVGLNHIDAYYQADNHWDDGPIVVNGASDLFAHVLQDKGTHSRAIFGVAQLPRNFCVGLTASFTLEKL
ncbi:RidA family protein [Ochrovirga pacifica]|uniref:RidA family protein n=1 Tax=Ochrovirga pacifica TaxID=1042376 RepID=UPI0002557B3C|nr:RidA family protein [Ochrovirga pacifica]